MAEPAAVMGWHRVCLNTIVRKEKNLDSERLRILPMGSRVNVVEKQGRRVRIDQPIVGWCSLNSSNGDTILKPLEPNQKVAPTPRNGQAAVTNLQSRVKMAEQQIAKADADGKDAAALTLEKEQLEARIKDLQMKNEQQQKVFEDWKKAAETQNTTESGTAPRDIQNVVFRDGDAVLLNKTCEFEGIVIVRCVTKDAEGNELIGCDYQGDAGKDACGGQLDGVQKWKPRKDNTGVWLKRENFKVLLPSYSLLVQMQNLEHENNELIVWRQTAESMAKEVKKYATEFGNCDTITFAKNGEPGTAEKGEDYAKKFFKSFTLLIASD